MRDYVAEPYRKQFIPGFDELRSAVLDCGALAMKIAVSGPSVFSLADRAETAHKAGTIMRAHFDRLGIEYEDYVVKVSNKGAKLIA